MGVFLSLRVTCLYLIVIKTLLRQNVMYMFITLGQNLVLEYEMIDKARIRYIFDLTWVEISIIKSLAVIF